VGWAAPLTGVAVFLLWIAPEWWAHLVAGGENSAGAAGAAALGPALAALPVAARMAWIAFRVAAATITVPLAEELAFRGYLARRIVARTFDQVPFARLTALAIAVSSTAFGVMHGHRWLVGAVAGVAYALVLRRRGRIGDAVTAHAITNLLLAAWVLARGDWAQW
jgi:CAAX prenyl protease-like protein